MSVDIPNTSPSEPESPPMDFFVQSPAWADFQRTQGHSVFIEQGDGWRFLASEETNPAGKVLYLPYGPVCSTLEQFDAALQHARKIAKEIGAVFVRVEPAGIELPVPEVQRALTERGLVPAASAQQPELTRIVELPAEGDFDSVLAGMKSTNRNLYRNIGKKGVTFRSSADPEDIQHLLRFLHSTAEQNQFVLHSDDYFHSAAKTFMPRGAAKLYLAELEGTPIAAAFVYDSENTRVYAHAGIDREHRKLSAGIPLVVHLIHDAQEKGLRYVDLWGVAPEGEPEHRWAGFTSFKNSFGGQTVARPGTWDSPVNTMKYKAYRAARSLRNRLRGQ